MAEQGQSRYVKLTRERGQLHDITPGELNQPIEVPQVITDLPFSISISIRPVLIGSGYLMYQDSSVRSKSFNQILYFNIRTEIY